MVYSMTGFGRSDGENDDFTISIEIKTVNHKYLDIQIKSPYYFNYLEEDIKKTVKKYLNRGRIEIFIKSTRKIGNAAKIDVDYLLAKSINEALNNLKNELQINEEVGLNNILKYDGVINLQYEEPNEDSTKKLVIGLMEEALVELKNMRKVEGENLSKIIETQLLEISKLISEIEIESPKLTEKYREDLLEKLNDIFSETESLDMDRISLEIALYADKSDITEEIVRLRSHIDQFTNTMKENSSIGRKLDFIIQEMNREVNTISSKSNDKIITEKSIELKTLIEKIREQIQNIE
ncbi:YicC/YloC family endoribonuclease [Miniphocaeibacter halophilus]|uniref:YicC family protein n=1 Tax=Miniphocaeibacter halophilus TaxID=2931922 RepID=A0AC61MUN9_9FIRM|nr:YicC/YloC family endoribonuclease [Miniphocaeibacter halophilus]QQK07766.1 YicC family protein [Miniphocaeibacter halophilus]